MRKLVSVRFIVNIKGRFCLERLAARVTDVRSFAGMDAPVILHGSLHGEAAAAYVAGMILHTVVHVLQVIVQTAVLKVLLTANVAYVRFFPRMHAHMGPVAFPRAKFLVAHFANHHQTRGFLGFGLFNVFLQTRVRFAYFDRMFFLSSSEICVRLFGRSFVFCVWFFVFLLVVC